MARHMQYFHFVENGQRIMLWVGQQASSQILEQIFGVTQLNNINVNMSALPELNNPVSQKVKTLIQKLQHGRARYLWLSIVRQGIEPSELEWNQMLIEDPQPGAAAYVAYLCRIHVQIQQEVNSIPSLTERAAMLNFLH